MTPLKDALTHLFYGSASSTPDSLPTSKIPAWASDSLYRLEQFLSCKFQLKVEQESICFESNAAQDRLDNCTEPTYFTLRFSQPAGTPSQIGSLIIIPIEAKEKSDTEYRRGYIQFKNLDYRSDCWDLYDSKGGRIGFIDKSDSELASWIKPLLQTGQATDDGRGITFRLCAVFH